MPKFKLRYCGTSWRGLEWQVKRRTLWIFWLTYAYIHGDTESAEAQLARFEKYNG